MRKGLTHTPPLINDPHTLLLLHGETIVDSSMYKVPITSDGVVASAKKSKFGGKSLYFGGRAHLEFPSKFVVFSDKEFTIDWWENTESPLDTGAVRYSSCAGATDGGICCGFAETKVYCGSKSNVYDVSGELMSNTNGQWVHWAIVRTGNTIKSYRNGKLFGSMSYSGIIYNGPEVHALGWKNRGGYNFCYKGYIDEFRISNVARWTSDFVPPAKPYAG